MKKCPFCSQAIQDAAAVCKHCGRYVKEGGVRVAPTTSPVGKLLAVLIVIVLLGLFARTCVMPIP